MGAHEEAAERRTNSLTILEEPFRASLCTLDSSLLDDFDFDLEDDFAADVDLEVDEAVLDDLVVLGSDMGARVDVVVIGVVISGDFRGGLLMARLLTRQLRAERFVDGSQHHECVSGCTEGRGSGQVEGKHVRAMLDAA